MWLSNLSSMNPLHWPFYRALVHTICLLALAWMLLDFGWHFADYTANRALMLRSGFVGLCAVVASFACSPIASAARRPQLTQVRRALGLYGFLFVCIHLLVYAWLDMAFDLDLMLRDLSERRAMSVGILAFVLLVPLAITSTKAWQRRLRTRWRRLHQLVFIALPLSALHYLWLERDVLDAAWVFAALIGALLLVRLLTRLRARQSP